MNINDVPKAKVAGDKLNAIFKRQEELEAKYLPIERKRGALCPKLPLDLNTFVGQERARLIIYRISEELFEAGNCMKNKAWKATQVPIDVDHFLEELADALHFFIQLFLAIGLSPAQVVEIYFKKSEVNKFRQRSKY